MKSSDKELRLTALRLANLNLVMFAAQVSEICFSASALTPAYYSFLFFGNTDFIIYSFKYVLNDSQVRKVPLRSSAIFPGYISLRGGKIAGIHVWKTKKKNKTKQKNNY